MKTTESTDMRQFGQNSSIFVLAEADHWGQMRPIGIAVDKIEEAQKWVNDRRYPVRKFWVITIQPNVDSLLCEKKD